MHQSYPILNTIFLGLECFSALVALLYLPQLKGSYWKWFSFYLIFICIQEVYWKYSPFSLSIKKQDYYAFIGIPIQYLFFYWLYALKALRNKKLYLTCTCIYLFSFIPLDLYNDFKTFYPINLTLGSILLIILVVLEFIKQINNDDILKFKENKMFYINVGVILFFVGTYPFLAFYRELLKKPFINIWNAYYLYFIIANCIMYLLFSASIIWGKHKL